ncbi:hypothetical protein [uncultured Mycolicibacterium sp.]|uniref:hypothetical protein n=1 Tax=uncultured Mycolicibacterium sp. TaxID=2320817 RepID=UPI002617C23D|nr:hypothetical protein [uncultured Mycolicibacterium sp.]
MADLRDLLELYGALDAAAAADPAAAETLNTFLPGAAANTGWYAELERFFFGDQARSTPDFAAACRRIATGAELTPPQKSRLLYGISVAARIAQTSPDAPLGDRTELVEGLTAALAAVGPATVPPTERRRTAAADLDEYLEAVATGLHGRNDFYELRRALATPDATRKASLLQHKVLVDPATLAVPLCRAAVRVVDGTRAVVVDTDMRSATVRLVNLKQVVNPFNWADNYPDFFIAMEHLAEPPYRPDRWRRVRETVGFKQVPATWLRTGLKYFATESAGEARIDYDLDEPVPAPGCDGRVTVDHGYVNLRADNPDRDEQRPGVRVRTRKVVRISGLSPFAQQRLVCLTGYGTASQEFLFGPATEPVPPDRKPFTYYDIGDPGASAPAGAQEPDTHAVVTAVGMWAETVGAIGDASFALAGKWLDGQLTTEDVTAYGGLVGARLAAAPLEYLSRVNRPRYPGGAP